MPSDILIIILGLLTIGELCVISEVSRSLHAIVCEFGWHSHLRLNPRPSYSLSITDSFIARPLARPWQGKLQPVLAISPSRLVVAAGSTLYSYKFTKPSSDNGAPGVYFEASCTLAECAPRRDITGIAFVPDAGSDCTLFVGFEDGALERVSLIPPSKKSMECYVENTFRFSGGDLIESLSSCGKSLLSLSSNGLATLFDGSSPSPTSQHIDLQTKSWSSYLSVSSSTPYAAFGTSSTTPLAIHAITDSELSMSSFAILSAYPQTDRFSAVYGICATPPSSPLGASDQTIISGWYDGVVRIHDLRSSSNVHRTTENAAGPRQLLPVLSLCDPWSFEPIYTVSCGGGSSAHIAAGSARHSLVSFWDVRSPKYRGWSIHAPGNDSSPVYDLILESSRLFGVNQSRPFVYDFGNGITEDTYPRLPPCDATDKLRWDSSDGISYYVTKYNHDCGMDY